jgi:hypothetical protein
VYHHGTDGDFVCISSFLRHLQGFLHEVFIATGRFHATKVAAKKFLPAVSV